MTKQTFKDAEDAERRIIQLEEELEKSKASEELLQKGSVLDQKKSLDKIKSDFEKDLKKAEQKIAKLTKQLEDLKTTSDDQKKEI